MVPLPKQFTPQQAMPIGTAGYTTMLCILALEKQGITWDKGEILVTGAGGGVGSFATVILAKLGYAITAACGRDSETDYLLSLGVKTVLNREEFSSPAKPIAKERWAGAIDTDKAKRLHYSRGLFFENTTHDHSKYWKKRHRSPQ